MVSLKINLIPGEERAVFEALSIQKKFKILATIFLVSFIFLLASLFLFSLRLNNQLKDIIFKTSQTENKIKSFQKREEYLVILKNRSGLVSKIVKERTGINEVLTEIEKIVPEGISFEIVESGGKGGMKITANSSTLQSLNKFVEKISSSDFTKKFSLLELSSITRGSDGTFNFIIELGKG